MSAPLPNREWSAETRRWWSDFWGSTQGSALPPSMHPTVRRLFGWYHRRNLLEKRVDRLFATPRGKAPDKLFVEGSTGQQKVNPLIGELRSVESQIEALERRLFGDQKPTQGTGGTSDPAALLDAANRRFAELAVGLEGEDPADPRLQLVESGRAESA